jgi:hypothetical protein
MSAFSLLGRSSVTALFRFQGDFGMTAVTARSEIDSTLDQTEELVARFDEDGEAWESDVEEEWEEEAEEEDDDWDDEDEDWEDEDEDWEEEEWEEVTGEEDEL